MSSHAAAPVGTGSPRPSRTRLAFIDNLRVGLTVLVVLHHCALSFMGGDPVSVAGLTLFTLANQGWFMGMFFLISGYFVPGSQDRKGCGGFVRDRLVRLGLPLAGYVLVLSPVTALDINSGVEPSGPIWRFHLAHLSVGALWFVAVLLVFSIGHALLRELRRIVGPSGSVNTPRDGLPSVAGVVLVVLALAAVTWLVRIVQPFGTGWWAMPTPSHLPQYVVMFGLGVVASRRDWLRRVSRRAGCGGFLVAAVATVVLLPVALAHTPDFLGGGHWSSFAYALWEASLCIGLALGLVALFRRRVNRAGRAARWLSDQAFTVYLLHLPVIACLTHVVRWIPDLAFLRFGAGAPLALAISFALAGLIRLVPILGRNL